MSDIVGSQEEVKLYKCKYCGATESPMYQKFDQMWKMAQHVRNECKQAKIAKEAKKKAKEGEVLEEKEKTGEVQTGAGAGTETGTRAELGPERIFKVPKTPIEVMMDVLKDGGLDQRVIDRCKKMAERGGPLGLPPIELEQILNDMTTGFSKKEIRYIIDDYYHGLINLQRETQESGDARFYGNPYGQDAYGGRQFYPDPYARPMDQSFDQRFPPRQQFDQFGRRYPPDPYYQTPYGPWGGPGREGSGGITKNDLQNMEDRFEDKLRKSKQEDDISNLRRQLQEREGEHITLATELKNLKENPPQTAPAGESDYEKTLKLHLEEAREDAKVEREERRQERRELTELIDKQQKRFEEIIDKKDKALDEASKRGSSIDSYKEDTFRFAGDGMNKLADVIQKKEPLKILIQGVPTIMGDDKEKKPPEREKVPGRSTLMEQLPQEYIER